tara:strand:- start:31 stop:780 length:750 start_codon:yes stop_codon:yes gene_type:complete
MTSIIRVQNIQYTDGDSAITIADGGSVGIGTTSPSDILHVKGFARIESNAGDAAYLRFDNDVNSGGKIWRAGAGVSAHGTFSIYNQTDNKFGINVDSNGHVTKPLQTAFSVTANQQNSLAINSNHTIQFANEIFDQNSDFDHSNYTFQAPVTGKYMLNVNLRMDNVQYAHSYLYMSLVTSNRTYESIIDLDRANSNNNNWDYMFLPINVLADMDSSDTAYVIITIPNAGSASSSIVGSQKTTFSGYLAC